MISIIIYLILILINIKIIAKTIKRFSIFRRVLELRALVINWAAFAPESEVMSLTLAQVPLLGLASMPKI